MARGRRQFEAIARRALRRQGAVLPPTPSRLAVAVEQLVADLVAAGAPAPVRELRFAPPRRWRFDLAWPARMLAVEIEGSVHRTRERFEADVEKYNAAGALGWRVIRITRGYLDAGKARRDLAAALGKDIA